MINLDWGNSTKCFTVYWDHPVMHQQFAEFGWALKSYKQRSTEKNSEFRKSNCELELCDPIRHGTQCQSDSIEFIREMKIEKISRYASVRALKILAPTLSLAFNIDVFLLSKLLSCFTETRKNEKFNVNCEIARLICRSTSICIYQSAIWMSKFCVRGQTQNQEWTRTRARAHTHGVARRNVFSVEALETPDQFIIKCEELKKSFERVMIKVQTMFQFINTWRITALKKMHLN